MSRNRLLTKSYLALPFAIKRLQSKSFNFDTYTALHHVTYGKTDTDKLFIQTVTRLGILLGLISYNKSN